MTRGDLVKTYAKYEASARVWSPREVETNILPFYISMLSGYLVTMAWRVLRWRMEEAAPMYGM
jgi:hypothetical protein